MNDIALACVAHDPNNSLTKYINRYFPYISGLYGGMYAVVTSSTHPDVVSAFEDKGVIVVPQIGGGGVSEFISDARRQAVSVSLENGHGHIHFIETDRLLQWSHSYPDELKSVIKLILAHDFLVIGRTKRSFNTHTRCQIETEGLSNKVCSLLLGKDVDVTCATRGMSKRAGEVILEKSRSKHVSTDSEWPIIIKCCTDFQIGYIAVEGLEFEAVFRHPERVMEAGGLGAFKKKRDENPESWLHRIRMAEEICSTAISTYQSLSLRA